jgi:dTDP-4-amino-4,6-dideoxygalactose transaminase
MAGGHYILGPEVQAFEDDLARFLGARQAIGVANGTDALRLALQGCGVTAGDEVITVSHTFAATVAAIELCGAVPVLVDVDPVTLTLDPQRLEDAIRRGGARLRAVIPVHLYGNPADMAAITTIAREHGLWVVEDCAQSLGADLGGRMTGTLGDAAAVSFYPTKNLGAMGDGGAIITNDPEVARRIQSLRQHESRARYVSEAPGSHSRLDEIQAAILRVKLPYLDQENAARRRIAESYDSKLAATRLVLPHSRPGSTHVYHQYVVRTHDRESLRDFLRERSIMTLIHYPVPVHLQPAYRGRLRACGSLERSEEAAETVLSLPMFPQLTDRQIQTVVEAIVAWDAAPGDRQARRESLSSGSRNAR